MQKINNAKNQAGKVLAGIFVFSLICGSLLSSVTEAAVNQQINYQGKLTDGSSVNVPDGVYNIKFRLYVDSSTTTPLWTELRESSNRVQVTSGLFSVMLGEVTDFTGVDFNQTLYLGVTVGGSSTTPAYDPEMSPRKKLGVVPAAIQAVYLGSASSTQYLRNDQPGVLSTTTSSTLLTLNQTGAGNLFGVQKSGTELFTILNNGNVGVGTTSPGAKLDIYGTSSLSTIDLFAVSSSTNTRLFTIGASGYVGVGVSSPGFKMDLQGTDSFSAYYTTRYSNDNQPTGVVGRKARGTQAAPSGTLLDDYIALLGGRGYGSTSFSGVSNGAVNIRASENFTDSAYGTYVTIETTPTGSTTRTEKLRITGSGNVGIGSTTPGSLLSVAGDISFTGALRVSGNAGTNGMILQTTGTGTQWIATTSLGFPVAVTPAFTIGNGLIYNATSTDLVGIGTTTPAEKLDVNGNISLNNNQLINGFVKNTIPDNKATNSGTTLTGTMYFADAGAISSGTVTGIGTLFSSELKVGDKINNITGASGGEFGGQAENFYIKQIVSNTSLILSRAGGSQSTGSGSAFSAKRYRSIYSVADNSGVLSFAITDGGFYGAGSNNYGIGSMAPNSFIWNGNAQFSTGANAGDISFYRWVSTGGWNTVYSSNGSPDLIVGDPVGANGGTAGRLSVGGATPLGALTAYTNTPTTKGLSIKGATAQSADYFNVSSSSGTGDIFTILSSGNVGVGSSTPGSLFSVAGDISFTGALRVSGNAGTNGMILQTTGTGAQWVATSSLGITGGSGNSAFTLGNGVIYNATSTDLVGIGTSTPYTTLTIQGKGGTNPFTIASSTGAQLFTVLQSGSIGVGTTTPGALFAITGQSGSTGQIFDVASSSGASYLHVMSSGNVGVGTSTPGSLFSVAGDISFIGALRTSGNAGVNGSVLQTTGTGSQWVATSTLGFLSSTVTSSLTMDSFQRGPVVLSLTPFFEATLLQQVSMLPLLPMHSMYKVAWESPISST